MGPFANATYLTQTRQISSWHADHAYFVWSANPWILRGGNQNNGSQTGVFAFGNTNGHANGNVSFRVVLNTIFKKVQK